MPFRKDYFLKKKNWHDIITYFKYHTFKWESQYILIHLDSIEISIKPIKGHNHVDFWL